MNISQIVQSKENSRKKYEYYRSLGYSEKVSEILSLFTYGERYLSEVLKHFPEDHVLDRFYAWLLEQTDSSPDGAVHREYERLRPRNDFMRNEMTRGAAAGSSTGFFGAIFGGAMKGAAPAVRMSVNGGRPTARKARKAERREALRGLEESGAICMEEACEYVEDGECCDMEEVQFSMPMTAAMPVKNPAEQMIPEPAQDLAELTATDSYEQIEEKKAKSVLTEPTSTFRMTTNTSSMGIVLNQIREGRHVDLSQVRIEELLNYFDYAEEAPEEEKFRIHTELSALGEDRKLLYIHAGARKEEKAKQNIILLLDVSGSMGSQSEVTQEALATVVSRLKAGDSLSLITYSSEDETVYDGYKVNGDGDKEDIMGRILQLVISGCTNGSAGIETAYECGAKHYIGGGKNQVILITDGDLNFGITKKDGLQKLIEEKKKSRLFLSVIGTGLYNYKDDKLEVLSKHGNGTYCVVNNLEDVKESVCRRYDSLTSIVAKDVKAQVEFNPAQVKKYRLLGYENRALSHADFTDDTVISEPYGSGGHGVALYELWLGTSEGEQPLKYQTAVMTGSEELCTVKIRYKEPLEDKSTEISYAVTQEENGGDNTKLARFLYCVGEKLRDSELLGKADEAYYEEMLKDDAWKTLPGGNEEKLELLVGFLKRQ